MGGRGTVRGDEKEDLIELYIGGRVLLGMGVVLAKRDLVFGPSV